MDAAPAPWSGSIGVDGARVYAAPGGAVIGTLPAGTSVSVSDWQRGPELAADNFTWADIGDGRFLHSSVLRHSPLPLLRHRRWCRSRRVTGPTQNLTQQVLTLFDGDPARFASP